MYTDITWVRRNKENWKTVSVRALCINDFIGRMLYAAIKRDINACNLLYVLLLLFSFLSFIIKSSRMLFDVRKTSGSYK